jgi:hypothetical protein
MDSESENQRPVTGIDDNNSAATSAPPGTLTPISLSAMNKLNSTTPLHDIKTSNGTTQSVSAESTHLDATYAEDARRAQSKGDSLAMPHSTGRESKNFGAMSPLTRQNSIGNGLTRAISSEFGPTRAYSTTNNLHSPEEGSIISNGTPPPQWSAAVGKANLGKSGRVIERLMGENDMLKRDLNIERLRAEESNQAVKMAEGKMEALTAEYESRLHDAAITKTLLKRRERQVADYKAQIEAERQKANAAIERERVWRQAMETLEEESKQKVEEAQLFAALMEGRNNTMTNHWKEQRAEVNRSVVKLGKEIELLVRERRNDDERMNMLQSLCEQQAEQMRALEKEKDNINAAFEAYKKEQEALLKDIKQKATARESENEETLAESRRVLGELRWALGVKKNVRDAQ